MVFTQPRSMSPVARPAANGRLRRIGDNGAPDWERSPSTSPAPDKPRLQAAEPRSRDNWGLPTKF
jgi:hypothetical protein